MEARDVLETKAAMRVEDAMLNSTSFTTEMAQYLHPPRLWLDDPQPTTSSIHTNIILNFTTSLNEKSCWSEWILSLPVVSFSPCSAMLIGCIDRFISRNCYTD